jgi:hypothetical protein
MQFKYLFDILTNKIKLDDCFKESLLLNKQFHCKVHWSVPPIHQTPSLIINIDPFILCPPVQSGQDRFLNCAFRYALSQLRYHQPPPCFLAQCSVLLSLSVSGVLNFTFLQQIVHWWQPQPLRNIYRPLIIFSIIFKLYIECNKEMLMHKVGYSTKQK